MTTKENPINIQEIGWWDSSIYTSKDFPKYNPDTLMTAKGIGIYKKMMTDDQVKAVSKFKRQAVISRKHLFEINPDNPQHEEISDFFMYVIEKMEGSFKDHLDGMLTALQWGFSITEKVYAPVMFCGAEQWGLKTLRLRPFDSFQFKVDLHGNIIDIIQNQGGDSVPIPRDRVIHFVNSPDVDEHYGESDLRACYRDWFSKDIAIKFQNIHLERHASGFIWAKVMGALTSTQQTDLRDLITNISAKMGAIVPGSVELNSFNPMQTDAFSKAISQYDKAIAKSQLVPNLLGLSEQGDTGSYSQSQTQLEVFFWVLDGIAKRLEETLNEQLFNQLALWNFGTDDFPLFKFEPVSDFMKLEITKIWGDLVQKGAVSKSDSDEEHTRSLLNYPQKSEPEEPAAPNVPEPDAIEKVPTDGMDEPMIENIRREFSENPWLRRVDFKAIEKTMDDAGVKATQALSEVMVQIRQSIEKQIQSIAGERSFGNVDWKEIEVINIPSSLLVKTRKVLKIQMQQALDAGYNEAKKELPKKRKFAKAIRPGMDKTQAEKYLSRKTFEITGVIQQDVLNATQRVLSNAIKYDKTLKQTIQALGDDTDILKLLPDYDAAGRPVNKPARLETITRTNITDAINQGRQALFGDPGLKGFVVAYSYSAILDDRVSDICDYLDGKVRRDWGDRLPPNHYNCRSLLVAVTVIDQWNGKESNIGSPKGIPQKGFA